MPNNFHDCWNMGWDRNEIDKPHTVWLEILAEKLFLRNGGFESNPPIFHPPKTHSVKSSLLQNHSLCTRPAAKCASLIVGMEFRVKSCIRGHRFSKEFCTPKVKSWLVCQRGEEEGDPHPSR